MKDGMATFRWADGDIDAARYTMNSRVGDGARWSADRKKAWRLVAGEPVEEISLERAAKIALEAILFGKALALGASQEVHQKTRRQMALFDAIKAVQAQLAHSTIICVYCVPYSSLILTFALPYSTFWPSCIPKLWKNVGIWPSSALTFFGPRKARLGRN